MSGPAPLALPIAFDTSLARRANSGPSGLTSARTTRFSVSADAALYFVAEIVRSFLVTSTTRICRLIGDTGGT